MAAVKDMFYDIESLFIDGLTPVEIAAELQIDIKYVLDVLTTFGVDEEDFEDQDQVDEVLENYYGA